MDVRAARSIAAPPERVFAFLEDLEHHVELIGDRSEPRGAASTGMRVRLCGPLGLHRTVTTSLVYAHSPESIVGHAEAGRRSRGTVRWSIQHSDGGSWVEVAAHADALDPLAALLLPLGGRRWLGRSLELALERLQERTRPSPAE